MPNGDPVAMSGSDPDIESARSMEESECAACAHARKQKRRVLPYGPVPEARLHEEPFASAPAIYDYNVPKYHAMHLRAREFAKTHQRRLSWTIARDVPLYHEDRTLPADQLREKLCRWLMIHDQRTAHITSILPLVVGLPVRLTESIDRARQLYRNRRGTIVGWAPHPEETSEEADNEWLLSHMPQCIYVAFAGATWKIHKDLEVGVYPLAPVSRTWKVNEYTGIRARRTGFFLLPDFASTAHMIQGATLEAVLGSPKGPSDSVI